MDHSLQEERWKRRGHTRKPNFVVRSIYAVGDWLGDFGPLMSSMVRGTSKLSMFAGYTLLLIITLAITICIIITSAAHSLELLRYIGFHSGLEYPSLFVVESIFLIGSIQMDQAFKRGEYFPVFPYLGFGVGLAFVLSSNVMGLADNKAGIAFGIATPFLLIISKGMLAWQAKSRSKNKTTKTEIATPSTDEKPPVQSNEIIVKNKGENEVDLDKIATNNIQNSPPEIDQLEPPKTIEENQVIATTETEEKIEKSTPEIATEKVEESDDDIEKLEKNSTTDEPAENKSSSLLEEVVDEVAKKPSKTTAKKKATKKKKTTIKVDDLTIENIALDYQKEHGELPGRKLLAQVAKCTEYRARKALAKLEETPPKKEEEMEKPKLELVNKKAVV
jgi:hypothetical protein